MSEALNAETILASIVELRTSIAESRKDTAELYRWLANELDFPTGRSAKAW